MLQASARIGRASPRDWPTIQAVVCGQPGCAAGSRSAKAPRRLGWLGPTGAAKLLATSSTFRRFSSHSSSDMKVQGLLFKTTVTTCVVLALAITLIKGNQQQVDLSEWFKDANGIACATPCLFGITPGI